MRKPLEESTIITGIRKPIPLPIGGWNTRDPLPSMSNKDAIVLDNIFPRSSDLIIRYGSASYATLPEDAVLTPHNIRTLMSYMAPDGSNNLFAADNTGIYEITGGGDFSAESPDIAATNGEWQYVNMTTAGGNFLWCCNGVDNVALFTGTAWSSITGSSTPAITGIATDEITNVSIHKNRIICTVNDSLSFWYLGTNSISGAASEFPLGALFDLGGYLVATTSWTLDAGAGSDDYFVAITSNGEVAIYKGTNPADAAAWELAGIYRISKPIGKRCFLKVGGDVYIITVAGLYPLSKALIAAGVSATIAVTDKISQAWKEAVDSMGTAFGWQAVLHQNLSMLFVNIPRTYNEGLNLIYSYQFVMNTSTGAWCRFTGQNAECWCVHNGELFFASHATVSKAWTGYNDGSIAIPVRLQTAFMPLIPSSMKRITLVKPIMKANADISFRIGIDVDYEDTSTLTDIDTSLTLGARWDTDKFDEAIFAGEAFINSWRFVTHKPGNTVSFRLRLAIENAKVSLIAFEAVVEKCIGLF